MYRLTVIDASIAPHIPWKKILLCATVVNSLSHNIVLHTILITFFVFFSNFWYKTFLRFEISGHKVFAPVQKLSVNFLIYACLRFHTEF